MTYDAIYRAVVVDNVDPKGLSRVRLRIPQILGEGATGWAYPLGEGPVPEVNAPVWATFEGGDVSFPVYVATGIVNLKRVTRCTSNTANNTAGTYLAPTGMTSLSFTKGRTYEFKIKGWYQAAATGYAMQHRLSFPALTAGSLQGITFTGTAGGVVQSIVSNGNYPSLSGTSQVMTGLSVVTANTNIAFSIEGLLIPSETGLFAYEFTPSAAGTVTVVAGTFITVTEVA